MILSELLQSERDLIKQVAKDLPDAELCRLSDLVIASLVRRQIEVNQGYHNCEINIAKEEFNQTSGDEWDVQMPSWTMRIVDVKGRTPGGDPALQSPWESEQHDNRGSRLRRSVQGDFNSGWQHIGDLLRLRRTSGPEDLALRIAKRPARMFKATVDVRQDESVSFLLPVSLDIGSPEIERGAYIGSRIMCSQSAGESMGEYLICTASVPFSSGPGSDTRTRIYMANGNSADLEVGDVIESMVPIDSANRLVVLMVARSVFERDGNTKGIRAIGDDLEREKELYMEFITPRQVQTPSFARRHVQGQRNRFDLYRDQNTVRYWGRR
ncbi:MAG: hypothetical protein GY719_23655 [bacterium]|nr:hypothetical protein [bacterium]